MTFYSEYSMLPLDLCMYVLRIKIKMFMQWITHINQELFALLK